MIIALLAGIVVGFGLAMPPGPIAVIVMKSGINGELRKGLWIGVGAAIMDIIYCAIAMLATTVVVGRVNSFLTKNTPPIVIIKMLCVGAMIWYGISNLRTQHTSRQVEPKQTKAVVVERFSTHGPFLLGIGMALANALNPTFLPSLVGLVVFVQHPGLVESTIPNQLLFSLGFGIGTIGWLYILLRIILHYRRHMSPNFIERLHQAAGLIFIGFGVFLGYKVMSLALR